MKEYIEGEGCLKIIIHTMVEDDYEGEGTSKLLKISHFMKIKKLPVSFLELISNNLFMKIEIPNL